MRRRPWPEGMRTSSVRRPITPTWGLGPCLFRHVGEQVLGPEGDPFAIGGQDDDAYQVAYAAEALGRNAGLAGALGKPQTLAHLLGQASVIDHEPELRRADHAGGLAADPNPPKSL